MNTAIATRLVPVIVTISMLAVGRGLPADDRSPNAADSAAQLVHEALLAEAQSDPSRREALLKRALELDPQYAPARWHAGYVMDAGGWSRLEQVQQRAVADSRLAEYRQLRDSFGSNPAGQLALARFCRNHNLHAYAKLHWWNVLQADSDNVEAIRGLGLKPHHGRLMTNEQIEQYDELMESHAAAREKWYPLLTRIRKAVEGPNVEKRNAALNEFRAIDNPTAIPFVAIMLVGRDPALDAEIIAMCGRIALGQTTSLLTQYAVLNDDPSLRTAALEQLKSRSLFSVVPVLMGSMATPVEMSIGTLNLSDGMQVCFNLYQEGPLANHSHISVLSSLGNGRGRNRQAATNLRRGLTSAIAFNQAVLLNNQVSAANAQAEKLNARIDGVLRELTGHQTDGRPQSWWKWWQEYNDLYGYDHDYKPVIETSEQYEVRIPILSCECFLPGTPVWTDLGPQPIEQIKIGDRVLAQSPDTGELTFQFVLQTTVRPATRTKRIRAGGEDIVATDGHPLWVNGHGWQMAKHLKPGWHLHTVDGPLAIEEVADGPESQVHNLVVANFNSYFVGQNKVLAHDNTARRPTPAVVPGLDKPRTESIR